MIIFLDEDGSALAPDDLSTEQLCTAIGNTYAEHQEAVWKLADETKVLADKARKMYDDLEGFSELIHELQQRLGEGCDAEQQNDD